MLNTLSRQENIVDQAEWNSWKHNRIRSVSAEHGQTALRGTHWINGRDRSSAQTISNLPGRWYQAQNSIVGVNLPQPFSTTGTLQIHAHEGIYVGSLFVTVIERDSDYALRIFDKNSPGRIAFHSIATFEPSTQWKVQATFHQDFKNLNLTAADGKPASLPSPGWIEFSIRGFNYRLRVTSAGDKLRAIFSDDTKNSGVFPFRLIDIDHPDNHGKIHVDFNRAFLPPLAFSNHFLCPSPPVGNSLDLAVEAGEKWVVFD